MQPVERGSQAAGDETPVRRPRKRGRWLRAASLVAVVGATAIALVACGGDDETQAEAETSVCTSLASFGTAVAAFRDLDPASATQEQYDAAADDVRSAWDDVQSEAGDLNEADFSALETAYDDLDQAIEDIPDDVPVADAIGTVQPQVDAVRTARDEMANGLGC
jgi:hypothetical protein